MDKLNIDKEKGWNEAIIDSNCDFDKFYNVAEILEKDLNIKFTNKLNDFDTIYWDFSYNGHLLTLHYNIYLGVSIHPRNLKQATALENDSVVGLGQIIFDINNRMHQY